MKCTLSLPILEECSFKFFPFLSAQRVSREMISGRFKAIDQTLESDPTQPEEEVESTVDKLEQISKEVDSASDQATKLMENAGDVQGSVTDYASETVQAQESKLKALETLYDENLASFLLLDRVGGVLMLSSAIKGLSYIVHSVQKKGNILYMSAEWRFQNVTVNKTKGSQLTVAEEIFFIGTKDDGLLVRVMVPSTSGRSDAYGWVTRWLSDFYVVL